MNCFYLFSVGSIQRIAREKRIARIEYRIARKYSKNTSLHRKVKKE